MSPGHGVGPEAAYGPGGGAVAGAAGVAGAAVGLAPGGVGALRAAGRRRSRRTCLLLLGAAGAGLVLSLCVGVFTISVVDVVRAAVLDRGVHDVVVTVRELRLPRAVVALLVGALLGLSGTIFQGVTRNPLASPDIIGITAGASAAAVVVIVVAHGGRAAVTAGALGGAVAAAALIHLVAWRRGISPYRLVLAGIGIAAVLNAVTALLLSRSEIWDAQRALLWLSGSLNGRGWSVVPPLLVAVAVLVPAALALTRSLHALHLDDDLARGLGVSVERARLGLLGVAVAAAAVATAAAGPIAFVAFVAPPVARRLVRAPVTVLPAALVGAVLLLAADVVGRGVAPDVELPVGVVTGLLGAPYLLWLLARADRLREG